MAHPVVDRLEMIDVENDERKRPLVTKRPRQLALQKLKQIALVVDFRERVDDRAAIDFLVVRRLDVVPGQKAVDAIADAHVVPILQARRSRHLVVDIGSVGALEVANEVSIAVVVNSGVVARNRRVLNAHLTVGPPADCQRRFMEHVTRPHERARWIDVDQDGVTDRRRWRAPRRRAPGLRQIGHDSTPYSTTPRGKPGDSCFHLKRKTHSGFEQMGPMKCLFPPRAMARSTGHHPRFSADGGSVA
jgi:hypothetical protein